MKRLFPPDKEKNSRQGKSALFMIPSLDKGIHAFQLYIPLPSGGNIGKTSVLPINVFCQKNAERFAGMGCIEQRQHPENFERRGFGVSGI